MEIAGRRSMYEITTAIRGLGKVPVTEEVLREAAGEIGVELESETLDGMKSEFLKALLGLRNEQGKPLKRWIAEKVVRGIRKVGEPGTAEIAEIPYSWESGTGITPDTMVIDGKPTEEAVLSAVGQVGMEIFGNRRWGTREKSYSLGMKDVISYYEREGKIDLSSHYRVRCIDEWLANANGRTNILMLTNQAGEYGIQAGLQASDITTLSIVLINGRYGRLPIFLDTMFNVVPDGLRDGVMFISHLHTDHANAFAAGTANQTFYVVSGRVAGVFASDPFKVSKGIVVSDGFPSRTMGIRDIPLAEEVEIPVSYDSSEFGLERGVLYIQGETERAKEISQRRPLTEGGKIEPIFLFVKRQGNSGYLVEMRSFPLEHGFPDDSRLASFKVHEARIEESDGKRRIEIESTISQIVYVADGTPRHDGKLWKMENMPIPEFGHLEKDVPTYVIFSTVLNGRDPETGKRILANHGTLRNRMFPVLKALHEAGIGPKFVGIGHHPLEESMTLGDILFEMYQRGAVRVGMEGRYVDISPDHLREMMMKYGLGEDSTVRELTMAYIGRKIGSLLGDTTAVHASTQRLWYSFYDDRFESYPFRGDPHEPSRRIYKLMPRI